MNFSISSATHKLYCLADRGINLRLVKCGVGYHWCLDGSRRLMFLWCADRRWPPSAMPGWFQLVHWFYNNLFVYSKWTHVGCLYYCVKLLPCRSILSFVRIVYLSEFELYRVVCGPYLALQIFLLNAVCLKLTFFLYVYMQRWQNSMFKSKLCISCFKR